MYIIDQDDDDSNNHIQSDMVMLILSLSYLTYEKAKMYNFDVESTQAIVNQSVKQAIMQNMRLNRVKTKVQTMKGFAAGGLHTHHSSSSSQNDTD